MLRPLLVFAVLSVSLGRSAEPTVVSVPVEPPRFTPDEAARVFRYLQYPSLVRLTETRLEMQPVVSMQCATPAPTGGPPPHAAAAMHLYASGRAIEAVKEWSSASRFPIGTILVKEKFATTTDPAPGLITVMEKVAAEGRVQDWLFTMIRLPEASIVRESTKVSCVTCHSHYAETDFVSATTFGQLSAYAGKIPKLQRGLLTQAQDRAP